MEPGEIRRDDEHLLAGTEAFQGGKEAPAQGIGRQLFFDGTTVEIQHKLNRQMLL